MLAYLTVETASGLRQGLFAQGSLSIGQVKVLAVPVDAVRTDKPQPYVQSIADGKVVHQRVTLGARGDYKGQAMVEVQGLTEGAPVLAGAVGALREGTLIKAAAGKS